jgi:hypothetical protein
MLSQSSFLGVYIALVRLCWHFEQENVRCFGLIGGVAFFLCVRYVHDNPAAYNELTR